MKIKNVVNFKDRHKKVRRPIKYTKLYELDSIPTYNCKAVKEFTDRRIDYIHKMNALKRKQEREQLNKIVMSDNKK